MSIKEASGREAVGVLARPSRRSFARSLPDMTSHHRGTRSPPRSATGVAALIFVVFAAASSSVVAEHEIPLPPGGEDYIVPRFWEWLQSGGDNEEDGEEQSAYPAMERNLR